MTHLDFPSVIPSFLCGSLRAAAVIVALLTLAAPPVAAQRPYEVARAPERAVGEKVKIRTVTVQPSKGVLAVVLNLKLKAQVTVSDKAGRRELAKAETDETGQAEFQLQRNQIYTVAVTAPGFTGAQGQSKLLKTTAVVSLQLKPQFARLVLPGLPNGAQVFIDDKPRAVADATGTVQLASLAPGAHTLLVRHPEFNDYRANLDALAPGDEVRFPSLRDLLERVAKLTIQGPAGATIYIDNAVQGKLGTDGSVRIDYPLAQASEHTIAVELLGYQPWTRRELLTPGERKIEIKLEPITTSAGDSDGFVNLSLWAAPAAWKTVNGRLQVADAQLGWLKNKLYRDFEAHFTVWLGNEKGATWAVRADKEGRNYYLFHLAGPKSTTHQPLKFYTYLVRDGGEPIEVSTPSPVLVDIKQPGVSFTIDINFTDHTIKHEITSNATGDKSDLGIYTDTTQAREKFLYGTFGFRSFAGETFQVDDFSIVPIKETARQ